jgi:ribosomal-protein-alanine N-acetyltransferase
MNPIETERLVLRAFSTQDASSLLEYLHKPTASCFFEMGLENMEAATAEAMKRAASGEYIAICLKDSGMLIGDLFAVQENDDTFSIGWNLNPRFGGLGYAFEAAQTLIRHLFTERAARRLYAYVETTNMASEKLCLKLGMRREGVFKEFVSFQHDADGKPVYEDTMQYAILRKEWTHPID